MQDQMKNVSAVVAEKEHYQSMLSDLYENGIIKQDGNGTFIAVEDPAERESIRSKSKQKTSVPSKAPEEQINSAQTQNAMKHPLLDDDIDKDSEMN